MFTVIPNSCYNTRNPIIIAVEVNCKKITIGMTVTCTSKNIVLGKIESMEKSGSGPQQEAKQGDKVVLQIKPFNGPNKPMFVRDFTYNDIYSVNTLLEQQRDLMAQWMRLNTNE